MAQKRMFSINILETDKFLNMPTSAQALYYFLGMKADDDGFVGSPETIVRMVSADISDLNMLIQKGFIYRFQSGVCVIIDWLANNTIQKDRYTPTFFTEEKKLVSLNDNKSYQINDLIPCLHNRNNLETGCNQNVTTDLGLDLGLDLDNTFSGSKSVCNSDTVLCEGEESAANAATPTRPNAEKTQDNINPDPVLQEDDKPVGSSPTASIRQKAVKTQGKKTPQKIKFADDVTLTAVEHAALIEAYGEKTSAELIEILSNYKGAKGTSYKSDYKAIKSWVVKAWTERNKASPQSPKTLNGKPIPQRSKTNQFWNMLVDDMEKQSDEQARSSEIIDVD